MCVYVNEMKDVGGEVTGEREYDIYQSWSQGHPTYQSSPQHRSEESPSHYSKLLSAG